MKFAQAASQRRSLARYLSVKTAESIYVKSASVFIRTGKISHITKSFQWPMYGRKRFPSRDEESVSSIQKKMKRTRPLTRGINRRLIVFDTLFIMGIQKSTIKAKPPVFPPIKEIRARISNEERCSTTYSST